VQTFQQGIGEILGDETSATIPVEDEKGETKKRSRLINFTSDRILVDSSGGPLQAERLQLGAPIVNLPASALLLRADGRIEMRDEASESVKGELAEMMAIYNRSLKDAELGEKKTSNSFGGMMGGMGGGMLGSQGAN
jgi:hypothetical protein